MFCAQNCYYIATDTCVTDCTDAKVSDCTASTIFCGISTRHKASQFLISLKAYRNWNPRFYRKNVARPSLNVSPGVF